jgi:serine/threonine protein kinase
MTSAISEPVLVNAIDFNLEEILGSGYAGTSKLQRHKKTGRFVVVKDFGNAIDTNDVLRQLPSILSLRHPCLLPAIGFFPVPSPDLPNGGIVTDYMSNGSLRTVLTNVRQGKRPAFWTSAGIAKVLAGIASAMAYLHSKDQIHGALHPGNILVDDAGEVHVGDFVVYQLKPGQETPEPAGQIFLAPERFTGDRATKKSDVYSFGLLLYAIFVAEPWEYAGTLAAAASAVNGDRPPFPATTNPQVRELIEKCWHHDPTARPAFEEIFDSLTDDWQVFFPDIRVAEVNRYVKKCEREASRCEREARQMAGHYAEVADRLRQRNTAESSALEAFVINFADFRRVKSLGISDTGETFRIQHKETNQEIVMKKFSTRLDSFGFFPAFKRALQMSHPCIVRPIGFGPSIDAPELMFGSEFMPNGSLEDVFQAVQKRRAASFWTPDTKAQTIVNIVAGMAFIHDQGLVHGFLHPGNVVFDADYSARIADFIRPDRRLDTSQGSQNPSYVAPELLGNEAVKPTSKADVYGFGLILWEILTGTRIWQGRANAAEIMNNAIGGKRPDIPSSIPPFLRDVVARSWKPDPKDRPSFREIFELFEANHFAFFDGLNVAGLRTYVTDATEGPEATRVSSAAVSCPADRDPNLWKTLSQPANLYQRSSQLCPLDSGGYWSGTRTSDHSEWLMWYYDSGVDADSPEFRERLSDWVSLKHPHVSRIVAVLEPSNREEDPIALLFEPDFSGTLGDLLRQKQKHPSGLWTTLVRTQVILGVALALEYLHSRKIVHGYLCADAILLSNSGSPLVADIARLCARDLHRSMGVDSPSTVMYLAPEVLEGDEPKLASDVYSFGVLLYGLVTGLLFFDGIETSNRSLTLLVMAICKGRRPPIPEWVHPAIRDMITRCWHSSRHRRPTFPEVLRILAAVDYPFFTDVPAAVSTHFVAEVRAQTGQSPAAAPAPSQPAALARSIRAKPSASPPTVDASSDQFRRIMADISKSEMDFSRHTWVKDLGRGGIGVVRLMRDDATRQEIAVKVIPASLDFNPERFTREVACLALNHRCLLKLVGYALPTNGLDASAKIGTEYMPSGSLDTVITRSLANNPLPFWTATGRSIILVGTALGLQFLDSRDIVHRDLKPGNILMDDKGHPRIADFGSVRSTAVATPPSSAPSTPLYRAPEQSEEADRHTSKIDVYAYGLILFEVLAGRPVFLPTLNSFQIAQQAIKNVRPPMPDSVHPAIADVITRAWHPEPEQRPTIDEILRTFELNNYPFYKDTDVRAVKEYVAEVRSSASAKASTGGAATRKAGSNSPEVRGHRPSSK